MSGQWHTLSVEQVLRAEEVAAQRGLSSAEAATRAERFGPNKFAAARVEPRWRAFIRQYADPMQIFLLAAGVLSLYPLKQLGTGILLILLTLGNAVLGLQQEGKAATAVAALQKMMIVTARVRRDGQPTEIPAEQRGALASCVTPATSASCLCPGRQSLTTTMSHRGGQNHDDATSSWLVRARTGAKAGCLPRYSRLRLPRAGHPHR